VHQDTSTKYYITHSLELSKQKF